MDILTILLSDEILCRRSIRKAARTAHRSASTASDALQRLEAAIAVPLMRREGRNLVLTVEAERRAPDIAAAAAHVRALLQAASWEAKPVPSLSIESLKRFSVVSHNGSIRGAARNLGVGQPQLTRQIATLEQVLGLSLLKRHPSGVVLSAAGRDILPHAEAVVAAWEDLVSAAGGRFKREIRTCRLGTVMPMGHESSIARILANLVVQWTPHQKRHPLQISNHTADELMAGLKARRFDIVLLDHSHVPPDFRSFPLFTTPLALVGDAALMRGYGSLRELLRRHPLALPSRGSGIRQEAMRYIEAQLGAAEAEAMEVTEVDSIPIIINLVANHGYISVLPQASLTRLPFSLTHVSLAPDHMQRLVMAWRRNDLPDALLDAVYRSASGEVAKAQAVTNTTR